MAQRNWIEVKSSRLKAVDFDPVSRTLFIKFTPDRLGNSAVYSYANVEPSRFQEFMEADSKGKFFGEHFKSNPAYPYQRLESEQPEGPTAA